MTFTEPGEYNVGYNLQDSTWSTIAGNNYAQFSVTEEAQQGTSVTVVPDITDDLHVGDTVTVQANARYTYQLKILEIRDSSKADGLDINAF